MNNLLKLLAGRVPSFLIAHVVCLCFWDGIGRLSAAPVVLSIPGAVTVVIEPAEAVAEGARWFVDGGAPQASGASVMNSAAGSHAIQFSKLARWSAPDAVDALIIGGKLTSVVAKYRPIPRFYFRATPEQRVHVGTTLEFFIHTDDPGDPQNPGAGTALQMTATPAPAGALSFDQASGHITYTPAVADRLSFTVRFATPQGLIGTVEVTPLNTLTAEQSVIEYDRPLPDAESRDYI